jgi:hypothetical protein
MVSRAVLETMALLSLLSALVAAGCFDVHSVETGPLVIDDFEDGDLDPADPTFGRWGCEKFPLPADHDYRCDIDGVGYQRSDGSLYIDATIEDPPDDGKQQHGGAFLQTVATKPKDIRQFSQLVFAAKLESGDPPLPSDPSLSVQLACKLARLVDGSQPTSIFVAHSTGILGGDWRVWRLALGAFTVPETMPTDIMGGTAGCLELVDTIRFAVDAGLPDGHAGRFILHIDDVELE